jgi:hypothetical protein
LTIAVSAARVPHSTPAAILPPHVHEEDSLEEILPQLEENPAFAAYDADTETLEPAAPVKQAKKVKPKKKSGLLAVVQQPSIKEEDQVIADEALRLVLPSRCHDVITKFFVSYDKNLKSRGYAGASTLIVQSLPNKNEERGIFIHEATHVLDLGCLVGTPSSGESAFRDGATVMFNDDPSVDFYKISWLSEHIQRSDAKKADFVTGYAPTNPFEDMAETVTFYVLNKDAFKARAATNDALAQKLAWVERYVISGHTAYAKSTEPATTKIPWDATKLSYEWLGKQQVAVKN